MEAAVIVLLWRVEKSRAEVHLLGERTPYVKEERQKREKQKIQRPFIMKPMFGSITEMAMLGPLTVTHSLTQLWDNNRFRSVINTANLFSLSIFLAAEHHRNEHVQRRAKQGEKKKWEEPWWDDHCRISVLLVAFSHFIKQPGRWHLNLPIARGIHTTVLEIFLLFFYPGFWPFPLPKLTFYRAER